MLISSTIQAQDFYKNERFNWMLIAKQTEPKLTETTRRPRQIVSVIKDENSFQGWKTKSKSSADEEA